MNLLDLFRPKWKNSDPKVRLASVQRLTASIYLKALLVVAKTDADPAVRREALWKLNTVRDPESVLAIARAAQDDSTPDIRSYAVKLLVSESVCDWAAAKHRAQIDECLSRLPDQELVRSEYLAIAIHGNVGYEPVRATQHLSGRDRLIDVMRRGKSFAARREALTRLGDPGFYAEAATKDRDKYVRGEAVQHVRDEALLAQIARADADGFVREKALKQISDPTLAESVRLDVAGLKELDAKKDEEAVAVLLELCRAYSCNDRATIARLEPEARRIGVMLNERNGIGEMRRLFARVEGCPGSRTLEMHWGGIGDWQG